jgi:hypothetical protein
VENCRFKKNKILILWKMILKLWKKYMKEKHQYKYVKFGLGDGQFAPAFLAELVERSTIKTIKIINRSNNDVFVSFLNSIFLYIKFCGKKSGF